MTNNEEPTVERIQFFFDESGKSDLSSSEKSGQACLIIAGILVPYESDFWGDVKKAWEHASELLSMEPAKIELHGWELYGGKGQWSNAPNGLPVLEIIFSALKKHNVQVYWTGLHVELLEAVQDKSWERVLVTYLDLLHKKFSMLEFENPIEVYGDANSWVKPKNALTMDTWLRFENKQVGFISSSEVFGVQVADVVAHTLYRSSKKALSNTDKTANDFKLKIARQLSYLPEATA